MSISKEAERIMNERFGKASVLSLDDENTVILKIRLMQGVLFSHGTRYDIEFS